MEKHFLENMNVFRTVTQETNLICRWGVSYPKWHFYVLDLKSTSFQSRDPLIKIFPIFALDPIRLYLDWALRGSLTS